MIYVYDFIFVIIYLGMKDVTVWVAIWQPDIYRKMVDYYLWCEFSFICLCVYFIPTHTLPEAEVAFFLCLATKAIHDIVFKKAVKK